jgi:death-associated protein kinase
MLIHFVALHSQQADVNAADKSGVSAMHRAAAAGHADMLRLLHEKGGEIDALSESGSPLHWASGEGESAAVETLLELGAEVGLKNANGLTPLIMAAAASSGESVAALADAGADVGLILGGNVTVLHMAADLGQLDAVRAILASENGPKCALLENEQVCQGWCWLHTQQEQ